MNAVDLSLIHNGFWERRVFTVPTDTPEERVELVADRYMQRAGDSLEREGFRVIYMQKPHLDRCPYLEDEDRKRYVIMAWVRRRPVEITMDIPEVMIPSALASGMQLN